MFKVVKGYEFAEVNDQGKIRSTLTGNEYAPYRDKDGYLRCKVWDGEKGRGIYVHRAIAIVFVPNPDNKPIVNHINSIRDDNRISNLEWVTPKENSQHGVLAGNFPKGEESFVSKYTDDEITKVCELLQEKISSPTISKITGIPVSTVDNVRLGLSWGHISGNYKFKQHKSKITVDDANKIKELLGRGYTYREVVEVMDHPRVNRDTVGNIALGKTFKHLN